MADPRPPTDHAGLQVLSYSDCISRLQAAQIGRLAFAQDGSIEVFPVNFAVTELGIAIRTSHGSKLGAALEGLPVAFEVDHVEPGRRAGWSVVVKGLAELIDDEPTVRRLTHTGLTPWADGVHRPAWILVRPDTVSGRAICRT